MKKILIVILTLLVLLILAVKGFNMLNKHGVLSNEAVFEVYIDMTDDEINKLFGLEEGTFNATNYMLVCKLPVETEGFKSAFKEVKRDVFTIDCTEPYTEGKHVKYVSYELNKTKVASLLVKRRTGRPLELFSERLGANQILGTRQIPFPYSKGKINRIVISKTGIQDYCKQNK